jgi:hypothetical protein
MLLGFIFTGSLLIIIGFLVKINPNLLAGYNTMSKVKKNKIDFDKVSTIARNVLILTGAAVIDASVIMYFLKIIEKNQAKVISAIIVLGIIILIIWSNRVRKLN